MVNFENPNIEKPKTGESLEKGKEKEMKIDPEVLKLTEKEIENERKEVKKPISLFPKKFQKFVATALLGLTIGSGIMAREAEAGQSRVGRDTESAIGNVIKDAGRGAGDTVKDIFQRVWGGTTSREKARAVAIQQRAQEREILRQQRDIERIKMNYEREIQKALHNYERERQMAQDELRRELRKVKTAEEKKMAEEKYQTLLGVTENNYKAAIKAVDERYGIKREATENQQKPEAATKTPESPEEKGTYKWKNPQVTYVDEDAPQKSAENPEINL
jgi:hypothetical protein